MPNMPKKPLNVIRYLDESGIDAELIAVTSRPYADQLTRASMGMQ